MTLRLNDGTEFQIKSILNNNGLSEDKDIDKESPFAAIINANGLNVTDVMKTLSDSLNIPSNLTNVQLITNSLKNVCVFNFIGYEIKLNMTPAAANIVVEFKR